MQFTINNNSPQNAKIYDKTKFILILCFRKQCIDSNVHFEKKIMEALLTVNRETRDDKM